VKYISEAIDLMLENTQTLPEPNRKRDMSTRRFSIGTFVLTIFCLLAVTDTVLAQEDFKGERRAPNPVVKARPSKVRTSKSARRPDPSRQIEAAIELGNQARDALDYSEAEKQYRRATALNKGEWRGWYGLGNVLNDMGNYRDAISPLELAVSLNPNAAQAHHSLATSYYFTERYLDAIEQYKQAVSLVADYLYAHYDLGMAYLKTHNKEAAQTQYEILKRLNPGLAANFRRELR
jgi:tetratricopeptide (TPR) repeat protein